MQLNPDGAERGRDDQASSAAISDAIDVSASTQVAFRLVESVAGLSGIGPPIRTRTSLSERSDTDRGWKLPHEFRGPEVSQLCEPRCQTPPVTESELFRARAGDQQAFAALTDAYLTQRWQRAEHREERAEQKREAKAALQREAYARYLSATEGVVMAVSTSPPLEDAGQRGGDRKRALREQNAQLITEMSVAEHQARLLAGDKVLAAIDTFEVHLNGYLERALGADDPSKERVGESYDTTFQALVSAMRAEQSS